jgi:RimJ/RimL family protein N-acetyltransferase
VALAHDERVIWADPGETVAGKQRPIDALPTVLPAAPARHGRQERLDQETVFRKFFADALASGGALVAIDRATGQIIGSSRYHDFDPTTRTIEIGWSFLARRYWGGRYNGEMKRLMLERAFKTVDQVRFVIGPANHRSRRAVEKLGAVYSGPGLNRKGRESVIYLLTKTEIERKIVEEP